MNPPQDPQGLLQRAPKLASLLSDAAVLRSVSAGDAFQLYAALVALAKTGSREHERMAAQALLKDRRLFAAPLKKAPAMHTFNGIGTRPYFVAERKSSDGSYITTLCATFLFLPVYPLAQYLVTSQDSTYCFLGKVPLSGGARVWRQVMHVLMALTGVMAGLGVMRTSQSTQVWLLNGLNVPVVVELDGRRQRLAAGAKVMQEQVGVGPHHIQAKLATGQGLEELDVNVPPWTDAVVYNVLGAAPLFTERIVYAKEATTEENQVRYWGGQSFMAQDGISDVFTPPPETLTIKSSSVTRWFMDVGQGGFLETAHQLAQRGQKQQAVELLKRALLTQPENTNPAGPALLSEWVTPQEALQFAHQWVGASGDALGANLYLQGLMLSPDFHPNVKDPQPKDPLALYLEKRNANPKSANFAYLYIRLLPRQAALRALKDALVQFPKHALMRFLRGRLLFTAGEYAQAAEELDQGRRLGAAQFSGLESQLARAWLASGAPQRAVELVTSMEVNGLLDAVLYSQVLAVTQTASPPQDHALVEALQSERLPVTSRAWFNVMTQGQVGAHAPFKDPAEAQGALLTQAAWRSDQEAFTLLKAASQDALAQLPSETTMLLAVEAVRRRHPEQAQALLDVDGNIFLEVEDLEQYLNHGNEDVVRTADPVFRSALHFVRARSLGKGKEAAQLMRWAAAEDILKGNVTAAMRTWKLP